MRKKLIMAILPALALSVGLVQAAPLMIKLCAHNQCENVTDSQLLNGKGAAAKVPPEDRSGLLRQVALQVRNVSLTNVKASKKKLDDSKTAVHIWKAYQLRLLFGGDALVRVDMP